MKSKLLALGLACSVLTALTVNAQVITPAGVTGSGLYGNSATRIIDGIVPAEGSLWLASTNVFWIGPNVVFTIDLGSLFRVNDLLISVDNNDRYALEYSSNGLSYSNLFTVVPNFGEVPAFPGGMDTMSTDSASSEYVSGLDFAPVDARFLRVRASGPDFLYSVGEVRAFGSPVPEPSTYGLMAAVGATALAAWRRRKARS